MSIPQYKPREEYIGAGNQDAYTFDFLITNLNQIMVVAVDNTGVEVFKGRGDDISGFFTSIDFDPVRGGGTVNLAADLPISYRLYLILAHDNPTQPSQLRRKSRFDLNDIEVALDFLATQIQRNHYLLQRSFKLDESVSTQDFDPYLPPPTPDSVAVVNPAGDAMEWVNRGVFILSLIHI